MEQRITIYDIEVFPNFFVVVFYDLTEECFFVFEISPRKDDRYDLIHYLKSLDLMVGFNNLEFDFPVLNTLIVMTNHNPKVLGKEIVREMKLKVNQIIRSKRRFGNAVRSPVIPQLDLYKMHHFDNVAKATSLKALEFVLRMKEIQQLPFPPETILTSDQMDVVIDYCKNKDVRTTHELYKKSQDEIQLRYRLSEIYNIPMLNMNDTKIGEQILLSEIRKRTNKGQFGKTIRKQIVVGDILFPYIAFYSPEFKAIHNWFSQRIITSTKSVFSKIPVSEVESLKPYINLDQNAAGKKMTMNKGTILKTLNIVYEGFQYDFGTGGIHGSITPGIYVENDEMAILDVDVKSYYPMLAIVNRYYPHHLDEIFCDIYEDIYHERQKYPKKSPENKGLKLGLNGAYGKSNSEYSELCDSQYTMQTTINGQLSLCMLSELLSAIPKAKMLQINTDGLTIMIPKVYLKVAQRICKMWEKLTRLELEYARYTKIVIRDVNNYLAVYKPSPKEPDKINVKRKGTFEYKKELHQNHSQLIVPKALEAYFVYGKDVTEFIHNHNDLWDFFKRVKLIGDSKLFYRNETENTEVQKLTRYYVSCQGGQLVKVMPPLKDKIIDRDFQIESGYVCTIANVVTDELMYYMPENLDYNYYVNECNKIIRIVNHST